MGVNAVNLGNKILDKAFRNVDFTIATLRASLHTADPGTTGASEATGGSYARQAPGFGAAAANLVENAANVDYAGMPAATITHVGYWDAASAGNFLCGGPLAASKVVSAGETFRFPTGDLEISIA